jgi:hypothetical protein
MVFKKIIGKIKISLKGLYYIFFFKWYCIFTTPAIILISKFAYIIFIIFLIYNLFSYVYNIKIKKNSLGCWIGVNWGAYSHPNQNNILTTTTNLFIYLYVKLPKFTILAILTTLTKTNIRLFFKSGGLGHLFKMFLWIIWAATTSLPRGVLKAAMVVGQILKKILTSKKSLLFNFKKNVDSFIMVEFTKNLKIFNLDVAELKNFILEPQLHDISNQEWYYIFNEIIFNAEYYNYDIYIIESYVPNLTNNEWIQIFKDNHSVSYIHQVIDLNNSFLILCLKKNFKKVKFLKKLCLKLNTTKLLKNKKLILQFLQKHKWSGTKFEYHAVCRSAVGGQIFSGLIDNVSGGLVSFLPRTWYFENKDEGYINKTTTQKQHFYKKYYKHCNFYNFINYNLIKKKWDEKKTPKRRWYRGKKPHLTKSNSI